jgi:polysaccharide deacetylase 2 family uncharacterized protein YibQ
MATFGARLGAGVALLTVGFLAGYVVGLVTDDQAYEPLDVAIAPSAGPASDADRGLDRAEEAVRPPRVPTADRTSPVRPMTVPSERPPRADIAAARLPISPPSDAVVTGAPPLAPPTGPMIAVVIDDLGLLEAATDLAIALDPSFTLSFLPYGEKAGELAAKARDAGHEVLLHMPMEPDGPVDPGPDALLTGLAPDEIRARLGLAFARVPQAMGLNNHMGSRFTADAEAVAVVLDEVNARGMMMLDSVTTPDSVIGELAQALGVPTSARDVFLDNNRDPALIRQQLDELERIAQATGQAIAICHPYRETVAVLNEWILAARERGFRLVPLSRLAKPQLRHPMIAAQLPDRDDEMP